MRWFDHCTLYIFVNITIHLWYICYYHFNKLNVYLCILSYYLLYVKIYTSADLHPVNLNIYTLAVKCSSRFGPVVSRTASK